MCLELQAILTILEMFVSLSININLGIYVCIPVTCSNSHWWPNHYDPHCLFWLLACDYDLAKWHIQTYTENKGSYILSPDSNGKIASGDGATENSITYVWAARCPRVKAARHLFFLFYPKAKSWIVISQTRGKTTPTSSKLKELITEWGALGFPTLNLSQLEGPPPGAVLQIKPSWRRN